MPWHFHVATSFQRLQLLPLVLWEVCRQIWLLEWLVESLEDFLAVDIYKPSYLLIVK